MITVGQLMMTLDLQRQGQSVVRDRPRDRQGCQDRSPRRYLWPGATRLPAAAAARAPKHVAQRTGPDRLMTCIA